MLIHFSSVVLSTPTLDKVSILSKSPWFFTNFSPISLTKDYQSFCFVLEVQSEFFLLVLLYFPPILHPSVLSPSFCLFLSLHFMFFCLNTLTLTTPILLLISAFSPPFQVIQLSPLPFFPFLKSNNLAIILCHLESLKLAKQQ